MVSIEHCCLIIVQACLLFLHLTTECIVVIVLIISVLLCLVYGLLY